MDLTTIKSWFERGDKPTQAQFAATFDSFRHKDTPITVEEIDGLSFELAQKSGIGHTHTMSEITDLISAKEVLKVYVCDTQEDLEDFPHEANKLYLVLDDGKLYQYTIEDGEQVGSFVEYTPSDSVIYSATDSEEESLLYIYNSSSMAFQDVTGQVIDKTIYITSLDELLSMQLNNGIYSILLVSGNEGTTESDPYSLTVVDSNITTCILEHRSGWAQPQLVSDTYQWIWHNYSYEGHSHEISSIIGLATELSGKASTGHSHSMSNITGLLSSIEGKQDIIQDLATIRSGAEAGATAIQQHQDISTKQDKNDNTLSTTAKTIAGAINEIWTSFTTFVATITEQIEMFIHHIKPVTWSQLVTLRNGSNLKPGQWYRITDYVTTVANDDEARSAGHPFDILVMATSNSTLSEDALAIKSSRDNEVTTEKFYITSGDDWDGGRCFVRDSSADGSFDGENYLAFKNTTIENGVETYLYAYTKVSDNTTKVYVPIQTLGNIGDEVQTNWVIITDATELTEIGESVIENLLE